MGDIDALIAEWERSKAGMFEGSFTEAGDALAVALAEQSQLREAAELELVEAHHHFGIQEGRITAAWDEGAQHVYEGTAPKCEFAKDREPCPYNPYRAATTTEGTGQ